ncbi:hypothetical protein, partial [Gaetbulibacter saemankumensis]|uniref:hypothetical protein n=1 Tax=Gaetbulibacter saemankumensis TaxID=311208 RepID=UPI0012FBB619
MYNFTQNTWRQTSLNLIACCLSLLRKHLKSIASFAVVMLFLFGAVGSLKAQTGVPCIDGDSEEWDGLAVTGAPTFELKADVFTGNQDDIFTGGKDFKSWGQASPTPDYSNWTFSPMQAKSDIMNAAAVIYTGINGSPICGAASPFNVYNPEHTYLFFAGDRESNKGTGYIGFWLLLNGSTAIDDGDKYFSPDHFTNFGEEDPDNPGTFFDIDSCVGDLLVLADFTGGGRDAAITVLKWVGPGNGTEGNNNSLVKIGLDSQVGQNNGGPVPVPSNFIVPEGQTEYDYNEFYEGVIDITDVFDLQNNPEIICGATWMLETRSSAEITADSKDFVGGSFNLPPGVNVSNDEVCVNGSASLTATVSQGNMVIENPVANGYTFQWSGPGTFNGQGTATIIFDSAQLSDVGDYSVMVTSPNGCSPSGGDAIGTLTVNGLPDVTANPASLECTEATIQLTGSPEGGTWSGDHVSQSGLFDATGLAPDDYSVTYTYTDGNGCTNSDDAIITVNIAPTMTVSCPDPVNLDACSSSDDIASALASWLSGFSVSGGVNPSISYMVNGESANDLTGITLDECGDSVMVMISATDECSQIGSCSETFVLNAPDAIAVGTPPSDAEADSCMFTDQDAVDAAYAQWITDTTNAAVASITGGCAPEGSIKSQDNAPDLCAGGTATVVWTITDLCETFDVEATWTLNAPDAIAVGTPPS